MKIVQLLSEIGLYLTNEEKQFIKKYPTTTSIDVLDEHNHWIAQNLVRKGAYSISNDNTLIRRLHENK